MQRDPKSPLSGREALSTPKVGWYGVAEYGSQLIEEIIRSSGIEGSTLVKDIGNESNSPSSVPSYHMVPLAPFSRMLKDMLI